MRMVVVDAAAKRYAIYEGRTCVACFVADRVLTADEVEALRLLDLSDGAAA